MTQVLAEIEKDFSVYNKAGVEAAKSIYEDGWFKSKKASDYSVEKIFDEFAARIEGKSK